VGAVDDRLARQRSLMEKHDLRRLVAEQQELLVRVRPIAGVAEEMFRADRQAQSRPPSRARTAESQPWSDAGTNYTGAGAGTGTEGGSVADSDSEAGGGQGTVATAGDSFAGTAGGRDSATAGYTDAADMASVASVENQLRDILAEQLLSEEEAKERRHNERQLASEMASSKFYVTHDFLPDGHKIFESLEARVPHGDKHIPAAFVKQDAPPGEIIYYK
jgi:hypothetical protein